MYGAIKEDSNRTQLSFKIKKKLQLSKRSVYSNSIVFYQKLYEINKRNLRGGVVVLSFELTKGGIIFHTNSVLLIRFNKTENTWVFFFKFINIVFN